MNKLKEFIQIIGKNRFFFLLVLVACTVVLLGIWQQLMVPRFGEINTEKSSIEGEKNSLQSEIAQLPEKYKELQKNERSYELLLNKGFMNDQNRIVARSDIDTIRMRTGLRAISYNIAPVEILPPPSAVPTEDKIMRTKIDVDMKGLTDLEMRDFVQRMVKDFRGLVLVKKMGLSLKTMPTANSLKQLSQKQAIDFTSGTVSFEWYTVVPKPVDPASGGAP